MVMLTDGSIPNIIYSIRDFGGSCVDFLGDLKSLVEMIGIPGSMIVLWAVLPLVLTVAVTVLVLNMIKLIRKQDANTAKQMENLANAITHLTERVVDPPMNLIDSLEFYYLVMQEHINKKLTYLGDILRKNSIQSRKHQIQRNIENEFRSITTRETAKLSKKKSVCGDMGKIVQDNIKWDSFLNEIYSAFFSSNEEHLKIQDIKTIMYGVVDRIAKIIEENGAHN